MSEGRLYVIGTPIGNLGDITVRALKVISAVSTLVCEDSRVTAKLVNYYIDQGLISKKPRYVPYNEFNEDRIFPSIIEMVRNGEQVGLVSDAGMPTLSDPGYPLIHGMLEANLPVEIIPGPTALTTALPLSGIGGEVLVYLGFLPKTSGKVTKILTSVAKMMEEISSARVALYVSPHRLLKDLEQIKLHVGSDTHCVLLRELTKQFEERIEGSVETLIEKYTKTKVKGELVLLISKAK